MIDENPHGPDDEMPPNERQRLIAQDIWKLVERGAARVEQVLNPNAGDGTPGPAPEAATAAQQVVDDQAEDEGLWSNAITAMEAYLQAALREIHAAVECDTAALRAELGRAGTSDELQEHFRSLCDVLTETLGYAVIWRAPRKEHHANAWSGWFVEKDAGEGQRTATPLSVAIQNAVPLAAPRPMQDDCPDCGGAGTELGRPDAFQCLTCKGSGFVAAPRESEMKAEKLAELKEDT